jgi:hypothetical protein
MFNHVTKNTTYILQQHSNVTINHLQQHSNVTINHTFALFWFYLDTKSHGCVSYLGHTLHLDNYSMYGFCPSEPQVLLTEKPNTHTPDAGLSNHLHLLNQD